MKEGMSKWATGHLNTTTTKFDDMGFHEGDAAEAIKTLVGQGLVVDSGRRRKNSKGTMEVVWVTARWRPH
jgi:hypothetical protein